MRIRSAASLSSVAGRSPMSAVGNGQIHIKPQKEQQPEALYGVSRPAVKRGNEPCGSVGGDDRYQRQPPPPMLGDLLKHVPHPSGQLFATRRPQAPPALPLQRVGQPLGVSEAQARQLPDAAHGVYVLSLCQQGVDFGPANCLVQERDQRLTGPDAGFPLTRP